jgi:hypothetical protein
MVDSLVQRLRHHPLRDDRVLWLGGVDDAQLAWLYDHAFVAVAPSIYEGLGVPVMEALHHGCPTISSTGGAQPEAGAGLSELFDPHDVDALVRRRAPRRGTRRGSRVPGPDLGRHRRRGGPRDRGRGSGSVTRHH